jgi:hypothetical protein
MTARAGEFSYNPDLFFKKQQPLANGCIEWVGIKNNIGYGLIGAYDHSQNKLRMITPHRLALTIKLGRPIAAGMNANHFVCHNRLCVNEQHLEEGTQKEKMTSMREQGILLGNNLGSARGSYNHKQTGRKYKYTEDEIQWVRNATTYEIAQKFNLTAQKAAALRFTFRGGYRWLPWIKTK